MAAKINFKKFYEEKLRNINWIDSPLTLAFAMDEHLSRCNQSLDQKDEIYLQNLRTYLLEATLNYWGEELEPHQTLPGAEELLGVIKTISRDPRIINSTIQSIRDSLWLSMRRFHLLTNNDPLITFLSLQEFLFSEEELCTLDQIA